jgi:hypothetical protein
VIISLICLFAKTLNMQEAETIQLAQRIGRLTGFMVHAASLLGFDSAIFEEKNDRR